MHKETEQARKLFLGGANCAQSVLTPFAEQFGIDPEIALNISGGFGGGMGGQRKTCGALTAAYMVIGLAHGFVPGDLNSKKALYEKVRRISEEFQEKFGTTDCEFLLKKASVEVKKEPSQRTDDYYRERPCLRFVEFAAEKLAEYI